MCTYDAAGNEIKRVRTNPDGSTDTFERTYDSNGNIIKSDCSGINGRRGIEEYFYDTDGNLIKEVTTYSDGGGKDEYRYEYDAAGNVIKEVHERIIDGSEIVIGDYTREITYDKYGNVTKEVKTYPDGDYYITEFSDYRLFYVAQSEKAAS